ncbi:hypothetical protein TNCV_1021031 [Trichonephila clavipes]|uniref:Uncharacterized protein n=1 Tax=Trichonephila clavipes TaxID=2585209 RepID=A0A8X6SMU0_TRICX|nr:hypothetical protein TNCV_1021031 [Trichonephila clavipes]
MSKQWARKDYQRFQAFKQDGIPDLNIMLLACVTCDILGRFPALSLIYPDTSAVVIRTQLKTRLVTKTIRPSQCPALRRSCMCNGRYECEFRSLSCLLRVMLSR